MYDICIHMYSVISAKNLFDSCTYHEQCSKRNAQSFCLKKDQQTRCACKKGYRTERSQHDIPIIYECILGKLMLFIKVKVGIVYHIQIYSHPKIRNFRPFWVKQIHGAGCNNLWFYVIANQELFNSKWPTVPNFGMNIDLDMW